MIFLALPSNPLGGFWGVEPLIRLTGWGEVTDDGVLSRLETRWEISQA